MGTRGLAVENTGNRLSSRYTGRLTNVPAIWTLQIKTLMRECVVRSSTVLLLQIVCLSLLLPTWSDAVEPPTGATFLVKGIGIGPATRPSDLEKGHKEVTHQVELVDPVSPNAAPQPHEVVQTLDEKDFPVGYSMSFTTHVCNDKQCLPVEVTMMWDALGYYTGLTYPPAKPLTKKEHVPFSDGDYAKLDGILKDRSSILKTWTLSFLDRPLDVTGGVVAGIDGVDAMTAPTPTTVKDSVIEDAAYTSWALWHWANGEIVSKLRKITEQRCTDEYLKHLLAAEDRRHVDYALAYLIEHHPTDSQFVDSVVHILENGEREQIAQTLVFLEKAIPDKQKLHAQLVESCVRMHPADCPIILQRLSGDPDLSPATLEALAGQLSKLPYFPIHLILRMLEERKFASETIIAAVGGTPGRRRLFCCPKGL